MTLFQRAYRALMLFVEVTSSAHAIPRDIRVRCQGTERFRKHFNFNVVNSVESMEASSSFYAFVKRYYATHTKLSNIINKFRYKIYTSYVEIELASQYEHSLCIRIKFPFEYSKQLTRSQLQCLSTMDYIIRTHSIDKRIRRALNKMQFPGTSYAFRDNWSRR